MSEDTSLGQGSQNQYDDSMFLYDSIITKMGENVYSVFGHNLAIGQHCVEMLSADPLNVNKTSEITHHTKQPLVVLSNKMPGKI